MESSSSSGPGPRVSIIIATYNRSNVLALVLASVQRQTLSDWEVLVVGDACTDDTAEVVAACRDARIRFINLPENCGDQSGPNNHGAQQACGEFIAWLNHDDLWLPDHLERALAELATSQADLVFTLCERITAESPGVIFNLTQSGWYHPAVFAPASCWVLRRELLVTAGPWRRRDEIYLIPSQDWLYRAWRRGGKLKLCPHLTVAAIASDKNAGSYARRDVNDHKILAERLRQPDVFRTAELTRMLTQPDAEFLKAYGTGVILKELGKRLVRNFWITLGLHPGSAHYALRTRKKGGAFTALKKRRGLPEA